MNPHPRTDQLRPHQFKKGEKRKPGPGAPRRPATEANARVMAMKAPQEIVKALRRFGLKKGALIADVMSVCLVKAGLEGNVQAIKELRESIEGKATQRIELLTSEQRQIEVNVRFDPQPGAAELPAGRDAIDVTPRLVEPDEQNKTPRTVERDGVEIRTDE